MKTPAQLRAAAAVCLVKAERASYTAQHAADKRERTARRTASAADRLLCCVCPTGLIYSDRGREKNGDYITLAYMNFRTLILEIKQDCPPDFIPLIEANAARLKAGDFFQTSASGQTIILGQ